MAQDSDNQLVAKVQNEQCEESLKELINRHSSLCYKIYNRYYSIIASQGHGQVDFHREKDYIIYESALTYNPEKAKFDTWVGKKVFYFCLNQLRRGKNTVTLDAEELAWIIDRGSFVSSRNEDLNEFVMNILGRLRDKRIKQIYEMRYFGDPSKNVDWRSIAQRLNVSVQTVINLHESAQKLLRAKIESKQIIDTV